MRTKLFQTAMFSLNYLMTFSYLPKTFTPITQDPRRRKLYAYPHLIAPKLRDLSSTRDQSSGMPDRNMSIIDFKKTVILTLLPHFSFSLIVLTNIHYGQIVLRQCICACLMRV